MLSDQVLQLLTAFVDGELGQRQREAVMRLLKESAEARDVLRQLQENAHKVKQLPAHKVEPSLVEAVLQAIAEKQTQPHTPTPSRGARRRWLPYVTASMAASILIGVVGLLCWKALTPPETNPLKRNEGDLVKIKPDVKPEPEPETAPKKKNPLLSDMIAETFRGFGAPLPNEKPFAAAFRDFQKDVVAAELARELNRDKAVQLEVTVKNNPLAIDRLRAVMKERGISIVTDPSAGKKLKDKDQAKVEYLVYAENLTPDEVTKMMNELGQSYVMGLKNNQKDVESPYRRVTVAPMVQGERQKVASLLGVQTSAIEPKEIKGAKVGSKLDRQAVLLPTAAVGSTSKEIQQFVNQRRATQPGTIQVLIKIRQE